MGNWLGLFLSPRGRIGRRSFWHGWLVLTLINVSLVSAIGGVAKAVTPNSLIWLPPLVTLYPTICLYSKRLHDLGRSGWLQLFPRASWAFPALAAVFYRDLERAIWVVLALWLVGFVGVIVDGLLLAWAGLGAGKPAQDTFD
jgi:uncharacterized membrane protein YhaH (DUF805 family)